MMRYDQTSHNTLTYIRRYTYSSELLVGFVYV